jgi:hypothetical protein
MEIGGGWEEKREVCAREKRKKALKKEIVNGFQ